MGNEELDEFDEVEKERKAMKVQGSKYVSVFDHENALMHKDIDNERAHKSNLFNCLTFIIITLIFVCAYTFRMNSFIDLIKEMNAVIVQLASAKGVLPP